MVIYIKSKHTPDVDCIRYNQITFFRITFKRLNKSIGLLGIYRPPSTNPELFLQDFKQVVESLKPQDLELIIGDVNICLNDVENNLALEYTNLLSNYPMNRKSLNLREPDLVTGDTHLRVIFMNTLRPNDSPLSLYRDACK